MSAALRTSPTPKTRRPSPALRLRTRAFPPASSTSMNETRASSSRHFSTMAAPIPLLPPVTKTCSFVSRPGIRSSLPPRDRLAANAPVDDRLENNRNHDHKSEGKLGIERVDAGGHDAGIDRADDVGGDERSEDAAGSAEHRCSTEEHRGDGIEEEAVASRRPEIIADERCH